mgnify:CR=1 FL=1
MKRKLKDIPRTEFIGEKIEVVDASNKTLVGLSGKVIDETRDTIVIENAQEKKLLKKQITIKGTIKGKKYVIDGSLLQGRPEDRIKKKIRI